MDSRVVVTIFLVHTFHMGPLAVWIGMVADWTIRSFIFLLVLNQISGSNIRSSNTKGVVHATPF